MSAKPDLLIRAARPEDAERISALIAELGFEAGPERVRAKLAALGERGLLPLVAEADEVVGCVSISIMDVLHRPLPVGRLSMLVVAAQWQGRGVGRALVEQALEILREKGCGLCEVTSHNKLVEAHAFYERLGFERTSLRLVRRL